MDYFCGAMYLYELYGYIYKQPSMSRAVLSFAYDLNPKLPRRRANSRLILFCVCSRLRSDCASVNRLKKNLLGRKEKGY